MRTAAKLAAALVGALALLAAREARAGGRVDIPLEIGNFTAPPAIDKRYMPCPWTANRLFGRDERS
jgi:hypothetical protein